MRSDPGEAVTRALLTLVMAGSIDATTNAVVELADIASMTGLSAAVVEAELDKLVAAGERAATKEGGPAGD